MSRVDLPPDLLRCFVAVASDWFLHRGRRGDWTVTVGRQRAHPSPRGAARGAGHGTFDAHGLADRRRRITLLSYARRLLELNDEAVRQIAGPATTGVLRLGVVDLLRAGSGCPDLLARFRGTGTPASASSCTPGSDYELVPMRCRGGNSTSSLRRTTSTRRRPSRLLREPLVWCCAEDFTCPPDRVGAAGDAANGTVRPSSRGASPRSTLP